MGAISRPQSTTDGTASFSCVEHIIDSYNALVRSYLLLRLLLRRHFFLWVRYVLMKDSIEKSARAVEFLRTKVSLMLPDYVPCRES